jgi:FixJ family two-component response regulator
MSSMMTNRCVPRCSGCSPRPRIDARGYASAGEFLLNPPEDRPGCLLLDLKMPGPSGMELHAALPSLGITLPVVFLTGHGDVHTGVRAMKGGAVDFLTKPVERETLLIALQRAVERDIAQRAARDEARKLAARFAVLSERERLVFDRIVDGLLNKQIADYLGVSERTVKADRAQVMAKLGGQLDGRTRPHRRTPQAIGSRWLLATDAKKRHAGTGLS